jgi:hypothetical protein
MTKTSTCAICQQPKAQSGGRVLIERNVYVEISYLKAMGRKTPKFEGVCLCSGCEKRILKKIPDLWKSEVSGDI